MLSDIKNLSNVKLIDFGLSAICHEVGARFSSSCGTPIYLAPE